jgi:hypothetical protein
MAEPKNPPHRVAEAKRRRDDNEEMWNRKLPPLGLPGGIDTLAGPGYIPAYLKDKDEKESD